MSISILSLGLCAASQAAPAIAQPNWSRSDTGIGSAIASNGQIAQAHGEIDSAWVRILSPDGQLRWTTGLKIQSHAPSHVPDLNSLVPTPDGGWIAGFDTSATSTSSVLFRFDSLGRPIGSPMSMLHDTALYLDVVAVGPETWVAAKVTGTRPTTVHRFGSSGSERDSVSLANLFAEFQKLFVVGNKVVAYGEAPYTARTDAFFVLLGTPLSNPNAPTAILHQDTATTLGYSSSIVAKGDNAFTYVTDSGSFDFASGIFPRVRAMTWNVNGDKLARSSSTTTDLVSVSDAWTTADGRLRLIGTRRIPGSLHFEPALVTLDATGATTQAKTIQPDPAVTISLSSVFGAHSPDGAAFIGVKRIDNSVAATLLNDNGDSLRSLSILPAYSVNQWYAQPDGSILNLGHNNAGNVLRLESWNTSAAASVQERSYAYSSLRMAGSHLILDLAESSSSSRLDIRDLAGRNLGTQQLGPLSAGRHELPVTHGGVVFYRLTTDHAVLVAKSIAR